MSLPPGARGAASIDDKVSAILDEFGGVGLTGWSVNGEGNLCSLGAGTRASPFLLQATHAITLAPSPRA